MAKYYPESWKSLFDQKEQALLENDCEDALEVSSFDELQVSLRCMAQEYNNVGFPDIINRLQPGFRYLDSFTAAITSASQYDPRACLVWGVIQAFVQSACQSQAVLDDMLGLVSDLNESLPEFETYLEMFPGSPALQAHLQDIYNAYMEYCIFSIQYMKRRSSMHFLTYFFASDPASSLRRTKENIKKHMRLFERTAKLTHRQRTLHREIKMALSVAPLTELPPDPTDRTEEEVSFPVSTVTMFQNYTFLGRDQELKDIHAALHPTKPSVEGVERPASHEEATTEDKKPTKSAKYGQTPACCVLQGLGGIGKTQTALEYSYIFREEYDAIFWIQAELDTTLAATFALLAKELGMIKDLGGHDGQNQGQAIARARQWLKTTARKWLLIFDNVEDIDDLTVYFPRDVQTQGAVIITTQKLDFFPITENFTTISISNLTREQGSELMFRYLKRNPLSDEEEEFARRISDLLGGLPLALATIGGYINQTQDTVSSFFESLKTSCNAWEASAIGPVKQYERTLSTVFEIALKELPENARSLVDILAFLNPEQIPEHIFLDQVGDSSFPFLSSKAQFVDTIRSLRRRQLVRRDATRSVPYLSIHRTVQWAILHDLSRRSMQRRQEVYEQAFDLVRRALPEVSSIDNPEPELWADFEKYVPQILHLRAHCLWPDPPVELSLEFAQVLSDMATFMWHAGLLAEGIDALRTAEHILDHHNVGNKNPLRSNIHEHIGIFASHSGVSFRDEAMSRRDKAIKAREESYNEIPKSRRTREDEIRRWNVQSDMAFGLLQGEEFAKAGEIIERCHDQYKLWGTPEEIPFEYLKYKHIISYTYMAAGRPLDAIKACKEGATHGEVCCGLMHPMTQHVRCSLANHLYFAGEIEESLKENLSVLKARSKVVGEFNHFTLESHSMCGSLYAKQESFETADYHFSICLDPRKRSVWNEEGVARAQFLYSDVLKRLGRDEEAENYLVQARATRDRFLKAYPQWLKADEEDELVVFDQMVCLWAGRYTGKLLQKSDEPEPNEPLAEEQDQAITVEDSAERVVAQRFKSEQEQDIGGEDLDSIAEAEQSVLVDPKPF